MKICLFCHAHTLSGANKSMTDWLSDSKESDNDYLVIIPKYNQEFIDRLNEVGVKKVIIGHYRTVNRKLFKLDIKNRIKYLLEVVYALAFNYLFYFYISIKLKREKVDIIHTNSFATKSGAIVSKLINVPHVWHIREFMEEDHQITHFFKNKVKKLTVKSHAIFISDIVRDNYKNKYSFATEKVIYNKIEYNYDYEKIHDFLDSESANILFVGSLQTNKGVMDAIQCVEILNKKNVKCQLEICGVGILYNELRKYCYDNHLNNIEFLGYSNDVINIRKKIDIALVCSRMEALGRTSIEAQYYENLLIGADAGCTSYIIDNGINGYLYEVGNVEQLAVLIENCITNKMKNESIIKQAKSIALKRFNTPIICTIEDLYDEIYRNELTKKNGIY